MAFSGFFGGGSPGNCGITLFEIRPDQQYIVFRGSETEAASSHLSGNVVLSITEPLTIKYIRLTLTGMLQLQ